MGIGIDLGTTNSLISVFRDGKSELIPNALGSFLTPSVVYLKEKELLVGKSAKESLMIDPKNGVSIFKRKMGTNSKWKIGGKQFDAVDLSSMVLRSLKLDAEQYLGEPISDVVISVPAYFNQAQRQATADAARLVGLNPLRLINEPTAAALAYGAEDIKQEKTIMIVDLGGGTFDVSLLNIYEGVIEVSASTGEGFLGGEDFSEVLAKLLAQRLKYEWTGLSLEEKNTLLVSADALKTHLTNHEEYEILVTLRNSQESVLVTRKDFEVASAGLLNRVLRPIERVLYDSNMQASDIDQIILVGGATRMPMVKQLVTRNLGQFPNHQIDPDHSVALGAAVQAALVAQDSALKDVVMTDVSPLSVGIEAASGDEEVGYVHGLFVPIIDRNTPLPTSKILYFSTLQDNQTKLELKVYQGEAAFVSDNLLLGEVDVKLPRNKKGREAVGVRITYDVSGLLEVDATVQSTQETTSMVISKNVTTLDQEGIERRLESLKKLKFLPEEQVENAEMLARLNRLFSIASHDDRDYLRGLIVKFKIVLSKQNTVQIEKTRNELTELLKSIDDFYAS